MLLEPSARQQQGRDEASPVPLFITGLFSPNSPALLWLVHPTHISDTSESHQGLNAVILRLQTQLLAVIFLLFFVCFLGYVMLLLGSLLRPRVPGLGSWGKAMFRGRDHGLALGKRPLSSPSLSPLPWHGGHGGCVAAHFGCGEQGSAGRPWSRARWRLARCVGPLGMPGHDGAAVPQASPKPTSFPASHDKMSNPRVFSSKAFNFYFYFFPK